MLKCIRLSSKLCALLLLFGSSHGLSSEAGLFEPIVLRSSNGVKVEIVAIHSVSPDGLTFSPKPDKPLIGRNKLQTVTTGWSNIDLSSVKEYPELSRAYSRAVKGESIRMKFGPHFHKISDSMKRIDRDLPSARYWISGNLHTMSLKRLVSDHGKYRPDRWSIRSREKEKTLSVWKKEYKDLEALSYRADIIRFRDKMRRAIRSLERISNEEQAFNVSAAKDLDDLLSPE